MSDLIARLEAASEGSRELSDAVLEAYGWHLCRDGRLQRDQWGWLAPGDPPQLVFGDPHPTVSLDAVLTLLPDGWRWLVHCIDVRRGNGGWARLESPDYEDVCWHAGGQDTVDVISGRDATGEAATPALALCIACLKARVQP